jgi:hypothetical protein
VPNIALAFPHMQFVFTTHSPIVAGTVQSENIVACRVSEGGISRLQKVDASIHGLNAEQILLSSYFQLPSTRAIGVESELRQMARRAMGGDDDAALAYLNALSGELRPADPENPAQ